ncbi:MAG: hypothetical protein R3A12_16625 [Ignavibacteria bacterium]
MNNKGFDIGKALKLNSAITNEWSKIGFFVQGNGTTSNANTYEYSDKNIISENIITD